MPDVKLLGSDHMHIRLCEYDDELGCGYDEPGFECMLHGKLLGAHASLETDAPEMDTSGVYAIG